jgi:hypothetical protein
MMTGGCFCGRTRYEIDDGNCRCVNCHCTMCRRLHAAPYVTWLVVPADRFRYTTEPPQPLASSTHGTRYFCPRCGTHVACINDTHPEIVDVSVGSLDDPGSHPPDLDFYTDTRLPWTDRDAT